MSVADTQRLLKVTQDQRDEARELVGKLRGLLRELREAAQENHREVLRKVNTPMTHRLNVAIARAIGEDDEQGKKENRPH